MNKAVFELGRKFITSPRLMTLVPWISAGIMVMGISGAVIGIVMFIQPATRIPGIAVCALGCGEIICGVVLFFTMTVVEDLLGLI